MENKAPSGGMATDEVVREKYHEICEKLGHEKDDPFDWCLFQFAWEAATKEAALSVIASKAVGEVREQFEERIKTYRDPFMGWMGKDGKTPCGLLDLAEDMLGALSSLPPNHAAPVGVREDDGVKVRELVRVLKAIKADIEAGDWPSIGKINEAITPHVEG